MDTVPVSGKYTKAMIYKPSTSLLDDATNPQCYADIQGVAYAIDVIKHSYRNWKTHIPTKL
jgi:hypothetical protein